MTYRTPTISAIIITKNEAHNIRACLESVKWVDEIVVVDSGSTDDTITICQQFTEKVFREDNWQGFGMQKNLALSHATCEWVLSIDADERITESLKTEIQEIINSQNVALEIPRSSYYCGKAIKHSGWWPDYVLRVFPRKAGKFSDDLVHERVLYNGKVKQLTSPLIHYSYQSLDQVLDKMNSYSSAWVKNQSPHKKVTVLNAVSHGLWAFFRSYFLRRGFLDGAEGFALAISSAEGSYYKYMKLYFLRKQQANE